MPSRTHCSSATTSARSGAGRAQAVRRVDGRKQHARHERAELADVIDAREQIVPDVGLVLDVGARRAVAVREPGVAAPVLPRSC